MHDENDDIIDVFISNRETESKVEKDLYWKDTRNISDEAYQFSINFGVSNSSPLNQIRELKATLKREINVFRDQYGVYVIIKDKLKKVLENVIEKFDIKNDIICIKWAGDGTYTANHRLLFMMSLNREIINREYKQKDL